MTADKGKLGPTLKMALDFGPLLVFFTSYRQFDLLVATSALIFCTLLSLAVIYSVERRLAVMPLVSGIAVTVFGGLTLLLQDEQFIKVKPTIVNLLFAAILLVGVCFKRPMLKYLLSDAMHMDDEGWNILSRRWGWYFIGLAGLNEIIWRNFSTDFWVSFKVFGMFTLTILFTLCQISLIRKYWVEEEGNEELRN